MGIPGVPWDATEEDIVAAIYRNKGLLRYVAKSLGVTHHTLYKRVNASERLQRVVADARESFIEERLDADEHVLTLIRDTYQDNPAVALKALQYSLNNLGGKRGYKPADSVLRVEDRGLADAILARDGVRVADPVAQCSDTTTSAAS